ncbi:hypothetical protein CCP3SC1_50041 [Gammaproteobacteria bacterium]
MGIDSVVLYSYETMFGSVIKNQRMIYLTQHAYLAGSSENSCYQAAAVDSDGNNYRVTWIPYPNYANIADKNKRFDRNEYQVVEL